MPPKGSKRAPVDGNEPRLAETLSYLNNPRPFKNPEYSRQGSKRNRTVKQILSADRERERAYQEQARSDAQNAMQIDSGDGSSSQPPLEQVFYSSIEAPPSILPPQKYCDITGLEGPYTHPTTGLRYHDKSIYDVIKALNPHAQQQYLTARGMNSVV